MEAVRHPARRGARLWRKTRQDFPLHGSGFRGEAQIARRGSQPRHGQGRHLSRGEAGKAGAKSVMQGDAAVATRFGVNRHAGSAESVDVAINGADGDFEFLRHRQKPA
jgi:hypothetical protein